MWQDEDYCRTYLVLITCKAVKMHEPEEWNVKIKYGIGERDRDPSFAVENVRLSSTLYKCYKTFIPILHRSASMNVLASYLKFISYDFL